LVWAFDDDIHHFADQQMLARDGLYLAKRTLGCLSVGRPVTTPSNIVEMKEAMDDKNRVKGKKIKAK